MFIGAAAPQAGQADYSQQWAEYYRSMGMIKEAEAIEMRVSCLEKLTALLIDNLIAHFFIPSLICTIIFTP